MGKKVLEKVGKKAVKKANANDHCVFVSLVQSHHRQSYNPGKALLSGEIVILRHGQPVDLIEPGEWLDGWGWANTIAVAWSDTVLAMEGERV